jgi:ferredoxin-NADP reductase
MLTPILNKFSQWFLHHESFAGYIEPVMQLIKPAWRAGYFRAQVRGIQNHSNHYLALILKPQKNWPTFTTGQHISLTVEIDGRLLTRVFTIASSYDDYKHSGLIRLFIKTSEHGRFTGLLAHAVSVNSWCNISIPMGSFVFNRTHKPVTFIAGGSGITPVIAMLKAHLPNLNETVFLIYYAKESDHQLVDELTEFAEQYAHFSFKLKTRQLEPDITADITPGSDIYCCGPTAFMQIVSAFAEHHNLNYSQEAFGLQLPISSSKNTFNLQLGHSTHEITANNTLLEQLETKKLPVKRGCSIGICHQCQCIKKSGVVRNLKTGDLSDNGEQLIQLCISQPVSDLELTL